MDVLEDLRLLLKDTDLKIAIGLVKGIHLAENRSFLRVTAQILPEEREIIATYSFDSTGPNAGVYMFPQINDLIVLGFTDQEEQAIVLRRLNSNEDTIPVTALDSSLVLRALQGKKAWLTSNSRINLSKGDTEPTENIVLGQVFKQFAIDLLTKVSEHLEKNAVETHTGNLGFTTGVPNQASDYNTIKSAIDSLKSSPISDEAILSGITFSEK